MKETSLRLTNGQTLLFIGDSITDCERGRPVGRKGRLGTGYVALIDGMVSAFHPTTAITVLNTGVSGNRVIDLERRWRHDVLNLQPDWLAVMIGINDVWRQFDNPHAPEQVNITRFEAVYRSLLMQTRPRLAGLVLMTPFLIEPLRTYPMRVEVDAYGQVVKRLATEFDALCVDVQAAFDAYLQHRSSRSLSNDRVHPDLTGHLLIARAFLQALDFDDQLFCPKT